MQDGDTPLGRAAQWGRLDTVKLLVRHGARIEHQNKVMWGDGWDNSLCSGGSILVIRFRCWANLGNDIVDCAECATMLWSRTEVSVTLAIMISSNDSNYDSIAI